MIAINLLGFLILKLFHSYYIPGVEFLRPPLDTSPSQVSSFEVGSFHTAPIRLPEALYSYGGLLGD